MGGDCVSLLRDAGAGALLHVSGGCAFGADRDRGGAVPVCAASVLFRGVGYGDWVRIEFGKLGGATGARDLRGDWLRVSNPGGRGRARWGIGRTLQAIHGADAAAGAVRALIGVRLLRFVFRGIQRRVEAREVSGSLDNGHAADLR